MKKPTKQQIIQWLQAPEFVSGTMLLKQINPNANPNNLRAVAAKLCYFASIPFTDDMLTVKQNKLDAPDSYRDNLPTRHSSLVTQKDTPANPSPITDHPSLDPIPLIVREHAKLVQLRSQLDEQRKNLGTSNSDAIKKKRRVLTQSIQQHSTRIEALYNAKEDYFNKAIMPNLEALGIMGAAQPSHPDPVGPKGIEPEETSQDINAKALKSLRGMQKRDQNMLDYQHRDKQAEPNPMPDGSKRRSIMDRMAKRLIEIEKLKKSDK